MECSLPRGCLGIYIMIYVCCFWIINYEFSTSFLFGGIHVPPRVQMYLDGLYVGGVCDVILVVAVGREFGGWLGCKDVLFLVL